LKKKNVRPDSNHAADQEKRERITSQALAKGVRPERQQSRGHGQPPEIGLGAAQQLGRLRRAYNGNCEEQGR
jgi:hypothetical protein